MSEFVSNSGRYTLGHEQATLASHGARTAASSAAYLLDELTTGTSVLDVGCGPGTITLDLAEVVSPGAVVGVENVDAPLRAAREAAARRGDTTTRFERADALALPFDDDSFDVVHAHQLLQHLTDPIGALREMARVCRPGGLVAVREADYAAMTWYPELSGLDTWRRVYQTAARANGAEPDAGRRLRAWAQAADLGHVRFTASVWNYADTDTCRWWGDSQAERFSSPVFAAQVEEQGVPASDLTAIADAWRAWGAHPDAWFALLHGELLARM